jgi:hypothetical protein
VVLLFFVCLLSIFFLWYWGLNSGPTPWATHQPFFCDGYFQDRFSWTICLGWLWTAILLISASWVARITDVSHWRLPVFSVQVCFGLAVSLNHHSSSKIALEPVGVNGIWAFLDHGCNQGHSQPPGVSQVSWYPQAQDLLVLLSLTCYSCR